MVSPFSFLLIISLITLEARGAHIKSRIVYDELSASKTTATATDSCSSLTIDTVVLEVGDLIVNTTTIITGSFDTIYQLINNDSCSYSSTFRCFLERFNTVSNTLEDVKGKIQTYRSGITQTISDVTTYFTECR